MKDFEKLVRKSIELDPWVEDRGINGYIEELKSEIEEVESALENIKILEDNNFLILK